MASPLPSRVMRRAPLSPPRTLDDSGAQPSIGFIPLLYMQQQRTGAYTRTWLWILASPLILLALTGFLTESSETRQRNNLAFASVAALKNQMLDKRGFKVEAMHV